MRILHIVDSVDPKTGGTAEAIRMLARYAPADIESEVVTADLPDAPFLAEFAIPAHGVGTPGQGWYRRELAGWLRANRDRFDAVMVHGLWTYTGLAALRTIAGRKPYVVMPHGMLDPYFKRAFPLKHWKKWPYWLLVEYWLLRGAFRVLFTAEAERRLAEQSFWLWKWTPAVASLGSEAPPAEAVVLRAAFDERCPELKGKRFLLFLGRIDPKKGCDLLVEAFARVAASDTDLHLVMAGPDPRGWRQNLQTIAAMAGVEHRVHWPGMLQGEVKWGAFAACEAFVLPSHQENFGVAVVEALASGKPALLSPEINIAADVEAAGCGFVEPDTAEGTTRLLERWIAVSEDERKAMGERALETFTTRFDMRKNAAKILHVFDLESTASHVQATTATRLEAK